MKCCAFFFFFSLLHNAPGTREATLAFHLIGDKMKSWKDFCFFSQVGHTQGHAVCPKSKLESGFAEKRALDEAEPLLTGRQSPPATPQRLLPYLPANSRRHPSQAAHSPAATNWRLNRIIDGDRSSRHPVPRGSPSDSHSSSALVQDGDAAQTSDLITRPKPEKLRT